VRAVVKHGAGGDYRGYIERTGLDRSFGGVADDGQAVGAFGASGRGERPVGGKSRQFADWIEYSRAGRESGAIGGLGAAAIDRRWHFRGSGQWRKSGGTGVGRTDESTSGTGVEGAATKDLGHRYASG
jgi:hypothetical protein